MTDAFSFRLIATDGAARRGEIATPHGAVQTPAFMPVGTQATVKGLTPDEVRATGADILLGNTYHLMLRPGAERIAALGGLHKFMNWPRPILTDSGGFQVMSLSELRKIDETRASPSARTSTAPWSSCRPSARSRSRRCSAPTSSCSSTSASSCRTRAAELERAMRLSLAWAERCKRAFESAPRRPRAVRHRAGRRRSGAARARAPARWSTSAFTATPSAGSRSASRRRSCCRWSRRRRAQLPADRPRYLMGVGTPDDLIEAVARGIDMFDCVLPTRNGRHGAAFTRFGPINLENARHRDDPRPLDEAEPVRDRADLFARLSASSGAGQRDARRDAAVGDQSRLLPGADGGHARRRSSSGASPNSARRRGKAGRRAICRRCSRSLFVLAARRWRSQVVLGVVVDGAQAGSLMAEAAVQHRKADARRDGAQHRQHK